MDHATPAPKEVIAPLAGAYLRQANPLPRRPLRGRLIFPQMRLTVKVVPRAKKPRVELVSPNSCKVYVSAVREKGKANEAMRSLLAEYFHVPKSAVRIFRGAASREKIIEIER